MPSCHLIALGFIVAFELITFHFLSLLLSVLPVWVTKLSTKSLLEGQLRKDELIGGMNCLDSIVPLQQNWQLGHQLIALSLEGDPWEEAQVQDPDLSIINSMDLQ